MASKVHQPLILYTRPPEVQAGHYDCDCACAIEPPVAVSAPRAACSYDCDCACAQESIEGLAPLPGAHPWMRQAGAFALPLDRRWEVVYNSGGPLGLAVLNAPARRVLAAFDSPLWPEQAARVLPNLPPAAVWEAVRSLALVGLLRPMEQPPLPSARSSTLAAWLQVTDACNLSCPYCYVHKQPGTMSAALGRQAVERLIGIASQHGYTRLKLKYAGGEPTLRLSTIQAVHAHAIRRASAARLALEEVVLSNGVGVTKPMLDFFADARIALMISLDGGPAGHDRLRASRDGRSTHAAVAATVDRALERGLKPTLSITLTALNLEDAGEAVEFALDRNLPFNLNFYRECATGRTPLAPDPDRLTEAMLGIFDRIRTQTAYPRPLTAILDRARLDRPHRSPCAAGQDYLVVDTRGRVSACQMLLAEPCCSLADDDPLAGVRQHAERVFAPLDERLDCQGCRWRTACAGGCPLLRTGTSHPTYCQVYQALLPELMRLEASRLIAVHSAQPSHCR
jgi:uncharacterized protein